MVIQYYQCDELDKRRVFSVYELSSKSTTPRSLTTVFSNIVPY